MHGSKIFGVGGGFLVGTIISLALGIVVMLVISMLVFSIAEDISNRKKSMETRFWLALIPITYFIGALATVWYSYGWSVDYGIALGLEQCAKKKSLDKVLEEE